VVKLAHIIHALVVSLQSCKN